MRPLYILSFLVAFLFASNVASAQNDQPKTIEFKTIEHDFGHIPQGIPATFEFEFKNTGKKPLILETVNPSCGCTSPTYTKTPVKRKKKGVIKVQYNAQNVGSFNKTITVKSNGGTAVLRIKGTVDPKK